MRYKTVSGNAVRDFLDQSPNTRDIGSESQKILFLDFDGVLHPTAEHLSQPFSRATFLADFLESVPFCEIVISSSWRFSYSLQEMVGMLPISLRERVRATTGNAYIGRHARYQEIKAYLGQLRYRNITWRALDDFLMEFPEGLPELIYCNPNFGIQDEQTLKLEKWLKYAV